MYTYRIKDKLISIRVDGEKYEKVKEIIKKQGWCRDTFGTIFDKALDEYLKKHEKK